MVVVIIVVVAVVVDVFIVIVVDVLIIVSIAVFLINKLEAGKSEAKVYLKSSLNWQQ